MLQFPPTRIRPVPSWRSEFAATLTLGWPLILGNLAQNALTTADVILLGWQGPTALAASALGTNLYFTFFIFGIGVTAAVAPLLAEEIGRNRHSVREVRRIVRQGFWMSGALAVPMSVVLWNGEAIILLLGQAPELAREAGAYLRALQWAIPPFLGFLVLRQFIAALGRPGWALVVNLAAVPVNVLLAWALIFGRYGLPPFGIVGAGIATSIVAVLMFLGLGAVVVLDRQFRRYRLFGRVWRADGSRFRRLARLGLPIGGTLLFEVTVFNAAAFAMGLIGAAELAAHAIALQIGATSFMVPMGLGQAATIRVGLAYGARDREGIGRAGWAAFMLGIGFMTATALLFVAQPRTLVGLFLDVANPKNAAVIGFAVTFLAYAALFQIADGAQAVGAGMLRGLQDTRVPMLICAIGYWGIGAPLGVALGFGTTLAGRGIWIGLACGLAAVAVLLILRWLRRDRLAGLRAAA